MKFGPLPYSIPDLTGSCRGHPGMQEVRLHLTDYIYTLEHAQSSKKVMTDDRLVAQKDPRKRLIHRV